MKIGEVVTGPGVSGKLFAGIGTRVTVELGEPRHAEDENLKSIQGRL